MMTAERLRQEQPVVYQTLWNGLHSNSVSHAYLFTGPNGTPKLETAYLLAQSILCEEPEVFACGECVICQRILVHNYSDFIVLDGSEASIKKEQIIKLQERFHKTGLEQYGKKIYIINEADNATPEALNSLLKFLEEPAGTQVYAILITSKIDRLLDTIISRCQNIAFRPLGIEACAEKSIELGVEKEDAYLLSRIVKDPNQVNALSIQSEYQKTKTYFFEIMDAFLSHPVSGALALQRCMKDDKKFEKQTLKLLIDLMIVFFHEAITPTFTSSQPLWNELVQKASSIPNLEQVIHVLLETNDSLQRYPNLNLIADQMIYRMTQKVKA